MYLTASLSNATLNPLTFTPQTV